MCKLNICGWSQVAEALPVQSQADVMQTELEACLSLEYTPESLPLLLHQVTNTLLTHTHTLN